MDSSTIAISSSRHTSTASGTRGAARRRNGGFPGHRPRGQPERQTTDTAENERVIHDREASDVQGSRSRATLRRGGRSGRRVHPRNAVIGQDRITPQGRRFGGHLTANNSTRENGSQGSALQAAATVFVPRQTLAKSRPSNHAANNPIRTEPGPSLHGIKSQASDIATRIHEDIANAQYECPICTGEIDRKSKVWSCDLCWTVFHLSCIKKWSANESAKTQPANADDHDSTRHWRCPGCNLPKHEMPSRYSCWCGKEEEPRAPEGIPPHSCGQSCSRIRPGQCPHPHTDLCHAGPCPPCQEMGPTKPCFCGKHQLTKPCTLTRYDTGWACGEPCGARLSCGEHVCQRDCHEGPCGPCEIRSLAKCYCGKVERQISCGDQAAAKSSFSSTTDESGSKLVLAWVGRFDCQSTCDRPYDCGVHRCQRGCHVQEVDPVQCPLAPDLVKICPCGKTKLTEISASPRTSCSDPVARCDKVCLQTLPCGHLCPDICHPQTHCLPCSEKMEISCRCGRTTSRSLCHQGNLEQPQCTRICRTNLNCGRHVCDEHCCTGERKAVERTSARKKHRPLTSTPRIVEDLIEPEHICTRMCDRLLSCGNHRDEGLCHKGPCGACREAIFDEISCHCGRTVLQPPLPCGTPPPPCRYLCNRGKHCGHPQVAHNCHQDDEPCPRCPFLVEKRCLCGKKTLKNQQCWLPEVRCGEICGRLLKCGTHRCRKPCHSPGECEDAQGGCEQPCGKSKPICGHPDEALCHSIFACKQETPCQSKIFIMCECQAQRQEARCGVSKTSDGDTAKVLPCNEECARLERNRRLALALNIDQSTHVAGGDHIPYSKETLDMFAKHTRWAQDQEREFRVFATSDEERRLRFKPMKSSQRQFLHLLAQDFGFESESMDPEPHRHIMIWKTPRFISAPRKTLAESQRLRHATRLSALSSANVSESESTARKPRSSNEVDDPYNAIIITSPRFGLTVDEVRAEISNATTSACPISFDIEFLPSEEVVLKAKTSVMDIHDLGRSLETIKPSLSSSFAIKSFGNACLCTVDSSLNVIRREPETGNTDNGWSRVAAKKAAPRTSMLGNNPDSVHQNSFAALTGNKMTFLKKKVPMRPKPMLDQDEVVEDWELAASSEQERDEQERDTVKPVDQQSGTISNETVLLPESPVTHPDL